MCLAQDLQLKIPAAATLLCATRLAMYIEEAIYNSIFPVVRSSSILGGVESVKPPVMVDSPLRLTDLRVVPVGWTPTHATEVGKPKLNSINQNQIR
jgi:hypothetical protein